MRVLVVDDHTLFRDSLRMLMESRGHRVVGEAGTGEEALRMARELQPDLVLMDLTMPGMGGIEATRALVAEGGLRVVVVTAATDDEHLFDAIKAGAQGYVIKDVGAERFFDLLEGALDGRPALTPDLSRKVLKAFAHDPRREAASRDPDALTERERQVLLLMVEGTTSNHDLADQLGLTENTVKFHVRNILEKLRLHDRAQAVGYALREGLVHPSGE